MSELQTKKKRLTSKYNQLKKTQDIHLQIQNSRQLIALCIELQGLLEKEKPSQDNFRWTRQINDIKKTVTQIQQDALKKKQLKEKKEIPNVMIKEKMNKEEMSKRIVRSIAFQQLTSKELKYSNSELEKIAERMENNQNIMEEIEMMIKEQGEDIDRIEDNITKAYKCTQDANEDLKQAADLQTMARMRKIRMGLMGILAAIGWGIVGIPGMIVGLFAGWKGTKSSSS